MNHILSMIVEIAESYHVSDHRFGIYAKSYVYGEVLMWISIFMESWAPNHDFGQNHVFAVREQLHRFRTKPTPDSESPWLCGILFLLSYVCHSLWKVFQGVLEIVLLKIALLKSFVWKSFLTSGDVIKWCFWVETWRNATPHVHEALQEYGAAVYSVFLIHYHATVVPAYWGKEKLFSYIPCYMKDTTS